jgi:hypothetical protein
MLRIVIGAACEWLYEMAVYRVTGRKLWEVSHG